MISVGNGSIYRVFPLCPPVSPQFCTQALITCTNLHSTHLPYTPTMVDPEQVVCPGCHRSYGYTQGFNQHLLKNKECPLAETHQGEGCVEFAWHEGRLVTRVAPPSKRRCLPQTSPVLATRGVSYGSRAVGCLPHHPEESEDARSLSPGEAADVAAYYTRVSHLGGAAGRSVPHQAEVEGSEEPQHVEFPDPGEETDLFPLFTTPPTSPTPSCSSPVPSGGVDSSIYEQRQKFIQANFGLPLPATKTFTAQVELASLLRNANTSIYVHDAVRDWVNKSVGEGGANFKEHPLVARTTFLSDLNKRFDAHGTAPIKREVALPSGKKVTLVLHDFSQMLYSLLTDESLMIDENLLFCDNNPFAVPPPKPEKYGDVNTGSCYRQAYIRMCTVEGRDVLLPIILFIDKTVTDLHGNLSLEPVSFTIGILTREVRNQARAWRPLGYVQNQSLHPSEGGLGVSIDYHFMLKEIFKSLVEVQAKEGIQWDLSYRGTVYHVVFKLPVLFIIGDTEGHDKMVGKYLNRTKMVKRLCRYCDTPNEETDNPFFKYRYVNQAEVENYLRTGNLEALKAMSMHPLPNGNAFHTLLYADDKRGVHGATPAEILHMILLGLFKYACSQLFGQANQRKSKKKPATGPNKSPPVEDPLSSEEEPDLEEEPESDLEEDPEFDEVDNTLEDNVLEEGELFYSAPEDGVATTRCKTFNGKKLRTLFDSAVQTHGLALQRQSDRDLPRSRFRQGIVKCTKRAAHEEVGVVIVVLLIFTSHKHPVADMLFEQLGEQRVAAFIQLFEYLLTFEAWLRQPEFTHAELRSAIIYLPNMLEFYKKVVNRRIGRGMKISKFHMPLHLVDDIKRFGSPQNVDSSVGEKNHITMAKQPAQNTQRRPDSFEFQTAQRYQENVSIERAARMYGRSKPGYKSAVPASVTEGGELYVTAGTHFLLGFETMFQISHCKRRPAHPQLQNSRWVELLRSKVMPFVVLDDEGFLHCYTEIKSKGSSGTSSGNGADVKDDIFRASPNFMGRQWYDWAYIYWGKHDGSIPAHLRLFFTVTKFRPNVQSITVIENNNYLDHVGIFAVADCLHQGLTTIPSNSKLYGDNFKAHQGSRLVSWAKKEEDEDTDGLSRLYVVPVKGIDGPVIAIPDHDPPEEQTELTEEEEAEAALDPSRQKQSPYLFLSSPSSWNSEFNDIAKEYKSKLDASKKSKARTRTQ